MFAVIMLLRPRLPACVDLAEIEAPPLLGVAENVVSGGDLLEFLFGRLVAGIEVGVQLLGEVAVSLGDVLRLGGPGHAENGIEIVCHLCCRFRGLGQDR